jgi:hypothetical protein
MAWPAVESASGSRIPLITAYFSTETASFEEVDGRSMRHARSPLPARQWMHHCELDR